VSKQQIIGSIFTGNLIFSKNKVRTTTVNEVVSLLVNSSKAFEKKKKGQPNIKLKLSPWVTPAGLLAIARDPQCEGPTSPMMSRLRCFHFLFAAAFASTGSAFTAATNKKCPRLWRGASLVL
jgi:hypothetical protein